VAGKINSSAETVKSVKMNARERFWCTMHFEKPDQLPLSEFWAGWIPATTNRWYREGLPIGMTLDDYFNFDKRELISIDFFPIPRFICKTLDEDDRYRTEVDERGIKKRILKTGDLTGAYFGMPQFLDFPVKNREDFESMKKRFDPRDPRRYPKNWSDELIEYYEAVDHPVGIHFWGFFWQASWMWMGLENFIRTLYKDPEFIHEMMDFWANFVIDTLRPAVEEVKIDYALIPEDMAYRHGPHMSPKLFREFILPRYKKVTGFLRRNGIDTIIIDSDGDPRPIIPLILEGGVNCLLPLEVQAGMDAVALRKEYGRRLLMIGNIDKKALIEGKEAIKREIDSKLPLLVKEGGYIPMVDHGVPPDVSFQNYVYYIELVKGYLHQV